MIGFHLAQRPGAEKCVAYRVSPARSCPLERPHRCTKPGARGTEACNFSDRLHWELYNPSSFERTGVPSRRGAEEQATSACFRTCKGSRMKEGRHAERNEQLRCFVALVMEKTS